MGGEEEDDLEEGDDLDGGGRDNKRMMGKEGDAGGKGVVRGIRR